MRRLTTLLLVTIAALLVPAGSSLASDSGSSTEPPPLTGPEYSPRCERQAFGFVSSGLRPVHRRSLTKFRLVGVLGFMDADCGRRLARMAVFDRLAGTKRIWQASRWTKWTKQRRFVRFVRTRRYQCGTFRSVYVQVWFGDVIRTFYRRGVRSC